MERNTMKIRTRMLALVLLLSMLLGLCGCLPVPTVQKGETAPEEELQTSEVGLSAQEEAIETLAADGYFTPLAREALSFDEMEALSDSALTIRFLHIKKSFPKRFKA